MDLRIGIAHSSQAIELELDDETDRNQLKSMIDAALAEPGQVLWLTDRKGKELAIPASRVSFIELGVDESDRRIGFGM